MDIKRTILIVDDEKEIRNLLKLYLEKDGYCVIEAEDGQKAKDLISSESKIDLILLDIMMPKINGIDLLKEIRDVSNIPVIIISAKSQGYDRILGLDLGADDYVVKPFDPLEVSARVSANIRRYYKLGSKLDTANINLSVKDVVLDTSECVLIVNDTRQSLTSVEFKILYLLMESPGRVFTKQQIYEAGWGEKSVVDDNSIMVCISKLRTKLNDSNNKYITTIRGLGYRFEK